jgi:Outer membrane protein beta-barrel domain
MTKSGSSLFWFLLIFSVVCQAKTKLDPQANYSLYAGAMGGWGSTTWGGLVPEQTNQNLAISMSTPIRVKEGGQVWGLLLGYELSPYFALEANYMHYPEAKVFFDSYSLFSFDHNGLTQFSTETESLSIMGKVMLFIPNSNVRAYSSAGAAKIHRQDMIIDDWRYSPSFGVGLNYPITSHLMSELGGNYIAGYGESQLNPTATYFPFLYSVSFKMAYCF